MPQGCRADGSLEDNNFAKPLPAIGLYIALASCLCAFLMAADTFRGLRSRRFWFPSKFFTLNAATLTVLAVATKLPVDLNNPMPSAFDQLSKLSSITLVCTVMSNLIPSLGVSTNLIPNIVALGILVVTITINICMQMATGVIYVYLFEHVCILLCMLALLFLVISSAIPISTTKRRLDKLYNDKNVNLRDEMRRRLEASGGSYDTETLRDEVEKYWLMAHTSSPQYVVGRSVTCAASGVACIYSATFFAEASVRAIVIRHHRFCNGSSDYGWSIHVVLGSQAIAIIVGTISSTVRYAWCMNVTKPTRRTDREGRVVMVQMYWLEKLIEWREAPLPVQISNQRCRRIVHIFKHYVLGFLVVRAQWLVVNNSEDMVVGFTNICTLIKQTLARIGINLVPLSAQQGPNNSASELRNFVLHLEGEEALVNLISEREKGYVERCIENGKKKKPTSLAKLIEPRIQARFRWAGGIDNGGDRVPNLAPEGTDIPPHCWALPIVILASIAALLPRADNCNIEELLRGVGEGLKYVKMIERRLETKVLLNQRKAADLVWYYLTLDNNIWFRSLNFGSQQETLTPIRIIQEFKEDGKRQVESFLEHSGQIDTNNTLDWPPKMLAANCLYRIASTIEQLCEEHPDMKGDHLFCWVWEAIGDLLGACLANLPKAIYLECFCNAIEEREEGVRVAASLLGEAEDILNMLSADELARSYPSEPAKECVDGWRERKIDAPNTPGWRCSIHRLDV